MEISQLLQRLDELKLQIAEKGDLPPEVKAMLDQKIRLEWSYHSNVIEGNTLTLGETKALLLYGLTAKGKSLKDHLDLKGHHSALKKLDDIVSGEVHFSEKLLKEFHRILFNPDFIANAPQPQDTRDVEINPGQFKEKVNFVETITGERVEFTSPRDVPEELHRLLDWVNAQLAERKRPRKDALHPLLIAAQFHLRFIVIHPFGDGNGRLARIFTNLLLMRCGFPPMIVRSDKRDEYISALNYARQTDDLEGLTLLFGERLESMMHLYLKAADGEPLEEPDDVDKKLALLKLQLGEKEPLTVQRSEDAVREVFKRSLFPLFHELLNSTKGFDELFTTVYWKMTSITGDRHWDFDGMISGFNEVLMTDQLEHLSNIEFKKYLGGFRHNVSFPFSTDTGISVQFDLLRYTVNPRNQKNVDLPVMHKGYNQHLTAEEVWTIVSVLKKQLYSQIESLSGVGPLT